MLVLQLQTATLGYMVKKCNLQQVELRGNHLLLAQLQYFNWGRNTLVSSLLRAIPHLIPMIFGQFNICWGSNAFLWIADRVEGISAFRTRVMQVDDLGEEWSRCPRPTWDSREWSSVPISPKYTDASLCNTDAHISSLACNSWTSTGSIGVTRKHTANPRAARTNNSSDKDETASMWWQQLLDSE
jgi:hypothetical protein